MHLIDGPHLVSRGNFALIFILAFYGLFGLSGCEGDFNFFKTNRAADQVFTAPEFGSGEVPRLGSSARVKVRKVFDGDTFAFEHEKRSYHVRLSGIDAPERSQPYGEASGLALRQLIEGRTVRIDVLKVDAYGRLVCKVILSDQSASDVSLAMLKKGLAWHFKRYQKDQHPDDRVLYSQQEDKARGSHDGLWQDTGPQAPWLYREQQRALKNAPN
jgi:endonuclease YncB( thermonuclease family)